MLGRLPTELARILGLTEGEGFILDLPARHILDTPFDPPAVECTQAGNPIDGRLHPARSRSFERLDGIVEPEVDARANQTAELHIVVLEINELNMATCQLLGAGMH